MLVLLLSRCYDTSFEVDIEAELDSRFIVVSRVREAISGGEAVQTRAVLLANLRPGGRMRFFFAEAEVVLTEAGIQTSD